jgi:hypothetical protein
LRVANSGTQQDRRTGNRAGGKHDLAGRLNRDDLAFRVRIFNDGNTLAQDQPAYKTAGLNGQRR